MRKLVVVVQISLDGFVAGLNGEFDGFVDDQENLGFVCNITDEADAAMFGRVSYQLIDSYWPTAGNKPDATESVKKYSVWYNTVPKYVLSNSLVSDDVSNATILKDNIVAEIQRLKTQSGKNILVFGSPKATHYLREQNLIDAYWILLHPRLFGQGIPLFKDSNGTTNLILASTRNLDNGIIGMEYIVEE